MRVSIIANHAWSYAIPVDGAVGDQERIYNIIDGVTSWTKWQYNRWDPGRSKPVTYHLASEKDLRFPTGLLDKVAAALSERGLEVSVDDKRVYPYPRSEVSADMLQGIELRDYQIEAVRACLEKQRGIVKIAAGGGKTECLVALIQSAGVYPVLWLTHTLDLMRQSNERIRERLNLEDNSIGIVGEGSWRPGKITVCMVQTMHRMLDSKVVQELLGRVGMLIIDEAHHVRADQFYDIAMACNAPYRFGVSATPLDMDDGSSLKLIGAVGNIIYEYSAAAAMDDGFLARPKIVMVKVSDREDASLPEKGHNWRFLYANGVVNHHERNEAVLKVCYKCMDEGRKVLVLVNEIAHGKYLEREIENHYGNNDHHRFMYGNANSEIRKRTFDEFSTGVLNLLVTTAITDEGVDLPVIDAVVLAGGGKSRIKSIQRVGRGMRRGGKDLVVYDFLDTHNKVLLKHARKRKKDYESMGAGDVAVVEVDKL